MKLFTQLALVTAIATCGSAAYAMQSMDDAALSDTTGQDGITILIAPTKIVLAADGVTNLHGITINQVDIFDGDGFTANVGATPTVYSDTGAISIRNIKLAGDGPIKIDVDSSGNGGKPVLNVKIALPGKFEVTTGDVYVTDATGTAGSFAGGTNVSKIANSMTIGLGGAAINVQLGNAQAGQGHLAQLNATIAGGLTINNANVVQQYGPAPSSVGVDGVLNVTKLTLTDAASTGGTGNLTLDVAVDVRSATVLNGGFILASSPYRTGAGGIVLTLGAGSNFDAYMQGVTLGSAASTLGDVKISGLDLGGAKLIIQGH